jgi:hypothetical protein
MPPAVSTCSQRARRAGGLGPTEEGPTTGQIPAHPAPDQRRGVTVIRIVAWQGKGRACCGACRSAAMVLVAGSDGWLWSIVVGL